MVAILLAVIGCYAIAAFMVHVAYRLSKSREETNKHYILVAENDGHKMEWYLRSFMFFMRRTGAAVRLTVVDQGSSDDTVAIANRLARHGSAGLTIQTYYNGGRTAQEPAQAGGSIEGGLVDGAAACGDGKASGGQAGYEVNKSEARTEYEQAAKGEKDTPSGLTGKRLRDGSSTDQLLWALRSEGIVRTNEQPIVVDLQNPSDLFKMPF